jgi:hypothetical protein
MLLKISVNSSLNVIYYLTNYDNKMSDFTETSAVETKPAHQNHITYQKKPFVMGFVQQNLMFDSEFSQTCRVFFHKSLHKSGLFRNNSNTVAKSQFSLASMTGEAPVLSLINNASGAASNTSFTPPLNHDFPALRLR